MGVHYQISPDKALHVTDLMTETVSLSLCLPFITCFRCHRHSYEMQVKVSTRSGARMALFVNFVSVLQEYPPGFGGFCLQRLNLSNIPKS